MMVVISVIVGPGQEGLEILKPLRPIIPAEVHAALVTTLKLGRISGVADSSDYVIYGAGSLRTGTLQFIESDHMDCDDVSFLSKIPYTYFFISVLKAH